MPTTFTNSVTLADVLDSVKQLTPHIEESAFKYSMSRSAYAPTVMAMTDMAGWNARKVSEYLRPNRASQLSELTVVPDQVVKRIRKASVEPLEWGSKYIISDRRATTDLESVVADTIQFLGDNLMMRREKEIAKEILTFQSASNTLGSSSTAFDVAQPIAVQQEFISKSWTGEQLTMIVHPYQTLGVRQDLVDLTTASDSGTRSQVNSWLLGGQGNLQMVESPLIPRYVTYKLSFAGFTSGTFKLRIKEQTTGDITYSATHATLATNIQTALNALSGLGTFTVTSASLTDITVTPATTLFVDLEDMLENPTGDDGAYLYLTTITGTSPVLTIREKSAWVYSPVYTRDSIIWDIRKPFTLDSWIDYELRGIVNQATEVYGVEGWRSERIYFVQTDATSPFHA